MNTVNVRAINAAMRQTAATLLPQSRRVRQRRSPAEALEKPVVVDLVTVMQRSERAATQNVQGHVRSRSPVEALEKPEVVVDFVSEIGRTMEAVTRYVGGSARRRSPTEALEKPQINIDFLAEASRL